MKSDFEIEALLNRVRKATEKSAEEGAELIYNSAKNTSLFKDKSVNLRRSIKKSKSKYKNGGYVVYADAPHAHLIEYGARGGQDGSDTDAPPLSAFTEDGAYRGQQKPRPFMRKAKKDNEIKIQAMFENDLKKVFK